MIVRVIQAPRVNLVASTMIRTVPVPTTPMPLIRRERCMRARPLGSVAVVSSRVQWRTMPIWDRVKEMNTPTM